MSLNINNSEIENLKRQINNIYYTINDITPMSNVQILSDISIFYPGANISSLLNLGGNIYITSPSSQYVFSLSNSSSSNPSIFESLKSGISIPQYITYSVTDSAMFLYDVNNGLYKVSSSGSLQNLTNPVASVKYIQSFLGNIYMLDPSSGTMYIASQSNGYRVSKDFASPVLKGSKSFAVDGNIFVVDSSGSIERFYANQLTPFNITNQEAMEYPLGEVSYIYDNMYTNDLFVVDPSHERVVVLQKPAINATNTIDYKFVKQYVYLGSDSKIFSHITYMDISSSGSTLYIVSGTKIIRVSL